MAGGLCFARCQGSTGSTLPPPGSSAVYSPSRLPPLSRRAGGSEAYFQRILDNAQRSIDPSNTVIGTYMCQGRMPQTVRERYVKMKGQPEHPANLDALIENFDRALSHPDGEDLRALQEAVLR